jgi:hypothetical protein
VGIKEKKILKNGTAFCPITERVLDFNNEFNCGQIKCNIFLGVPIYMGSYSPSIIRSPK